MTTTNTQTLLFNVGGITILHLSVEKLNEVYSVIEDIMNGDGIYGEAPEKEIILEAYNSQYNPFRQYTWSDMIREIIHDHELR
jgi:hypothetical protein